MDFACCSSQHITSQSVTGGAMPSRPSRGYGFQGRLAVLRLAVPFQGAVALVRCFGGDFLFSSAPAGNCRGFVAGVRSCRAERQPGDAVGAFGQPEPGRRCRQCARRCDPRRFPGQRVRCRHLHNCRDDRPIGRRHGAGNWSELQQSDGKRGGRPRLGSFRSEFDYALRANAGGRRFAARWRQSDRNRPLLPGWAAADPGQHRSHLRWRHC